MDERERARRMQIRRAKRRRNVLIMKCIISLLTLIVVFLAVIDVYKRQGFRCAEGWNR